MSNILWLHFEHFSSNFKAQENQIVKMITIEKHEKINDVFKIPITFQVSHAIADGYYVAMFFSRLQERLDFY